MGRTEDTDDVFPPPGLLVQSFVVPLLHRLLPGSEYAQRSLINDINNIPRLVESLPRNNVDYKTLELGRSNPIDQWIDEVAEELQFGYSWASKEDIGLASMMSQYSRVHGTYITFSAARQKGWRVAPSVKGSKEYPKPL